MNETQTSSEQLPTVLKDCKRRDKKSSFWIFISVTVILIATGVTVGVLLSRPKEAGNGELSATKSPSLAPTTDAPACFQQVSLNENTSLTVQEANEFTDGSVSISGDVTLDFGQGFKVSLPSAKVRLFPTSIDLANNATSTATACFPQIPGLEEYRYAIQGTQPELAAATKMGSAEGLSTNFPGLGDL